MNINWLFYSDSNEGADELEATLLEKSNNLMVFDGLEELFKQLALETKSVLFLKAHQVYNVYDLSEAISLKFPHVYIVILAPDGLKNLKKAMNAGASDILSFTADRDEVLEVITQAQKYMSHRTQREGGSIPEISILNNSCVISVCSAKGGIGRSMLTVNMAVAFAKQGKKVAVMDADLQFGDIAMYYDMKPEKTIYDWVKEGYEMGQYSLDKYMCTHTSGVHVLAAPQRPEFFEVITEEHLGVAIDEMKKRYDVILIDQSNYISEIHLKVLTKSDEILLLTKSDIPVIKNSRNYLDMLQSIQLHHKVKVVLNQDVRNKTVDNKKLEEILGLSVFCTLPSQVNSVDESINEGIPFILRNVKSPLTKGILLLGKKLVNPESIFQEKKKIQKRWFVLSK